MRFKNSVFAVAFFAGGYLSYQLGAGQSHQPTPQTVTLDHVQVTQIHPAALYVRTPGGKEERYSMDILDRDWAHPLLQNPDGAGRCSSKPTRNAPAVTQ
jgi:hypothetical protein